MAGTGWDQPQVYSSNLSLRQEDDSSVAQTGVEMSHTEAERRFRQFLRNFKSDDQSTFIYREQLNSNYIEGRYTIDVDMEHVQGFDGKLSSLLQEKPSEYMPIFEEAARNTVIQSNNLKQEDAKSIQVIVNGFHKFTGIRSLSAEHVSKLVSIRGIVVSAGRPRIKATRLMVMCRNCKITKQIHCGAGFGGARLPRECDTRPLPDSQQAKCPLDPYIILADNTDYIDQQRLKLQENPEAVPTGELPRHLSLAAERYLVGAVKPGTRVTVIGMYTTYEAMGAEASKTGANDIGIRIPYLRVFGIIQENEASDLLLGKFHAEDEEEMRTFANQPDLYHKIASSMCPAIFDNDDTKNIKQALAVQLFGGARKSLPDGMRLRGDINVLLLGDPSVAKSQFLKFVSQVAPIGVYTSGKGSSAAGLTASVIRDPASGEFHLEGGALVLADGGLVCIDEFDKMRDQDRVAIHEAMEQQTISIAKAGITTILNSRTSVLAAANPVFGRYDDMRSPSENIDFQTTILSRFDLIFIVRDIQDARRDANLAKHVINVHRYRDQAVAEVQKDVGPIDMKLLKKYIAFARTRIQPRLTTEAAQMLQNQYVRFRAQVATNKPTAGPTNIPMTVRQLEAIVRISEALARMELSSDAHTSHVAEAIRLFQVSTYRAATTGVSEGGLGTASGEFDRQVKHAEQQLSSRLAIGSSTGTSQLIKYLNDRGYERHVALKALDHLVQRGQFRYKKQQKMVERIG